MRANKEKILWTLIFIAIGFSVIYTSYKTLVKKDFIIIIDEKTE